MNTLSACSYELHLDDKRKRRTKKHELSDEQVAYLRDNYCEDVPFEYDRERIEDIKLTLN